MRLNQCTAWMPTQQSASARSISSTTSDGSFRSWGEVEANAANLNARKRKELDNIGKQIEECSEYHDRLHVIADKQIAFDLDDGVVVNYAKFEDVLQKLK